MSFALMHDVLADTVMDMAWLVIHAMFGSGHVKRAGQIAGERQIECLVSVVIHES